MESHRFSIIGMMEYIKAIFLEFPMIITLQVSCMKDYMAEEFTKTLQYILNQLQY